MPNETTPAEPQAGAADPINPQGQVPTTPPAEPQAGEPTKPSRSADDYERMIAELRKENAGHRTKLKSFEDAEKQRQEAELSEKQKLEKRLAELQSSQSERDIALQEERNYNALWRAGRAAGISEDVALEDAIRLINKLDLAHDEHGKPTNAADLMKALIDSRPWLKQGKAAATAPTAGGATSPARSQTTAGGSEITAGYVADVMSGKIAWRELSPEQKTAVLQWQAKNPYRF